MDEKTPLKSPPKSALSKVDKVSRCVRTGEIRHPYQNYFAIQEHDISVPRFDGSYGPVVTRAVFLSGDAVSVLPYDPVRDRVMLIEQFRFGPHVRGDKSPWKIEAIAGRIDAGETPDETARREMREETGLVADALIALPGYYPAPGAVDEFMYPFIGLTDLPDTAAGFGGLQSEAEDIQSHILSFAAAMDLLASGRGDTGPLNVLLLTLNMRRGALRRGA